MLTERLRRGFADLASGARRAPRDDAASVLSLLAFTNVAYTRC